MHVSIPRKPGASRFVIAGVAVALALAAGLASASEVAAAKSPHPTDWFQQARWGVMTHYLGAPPSSKGGAELTAEMWNEQVDAFDVAGLAGQLA